MFYYCSKAANICTYIANFLFTYQALDQSLTQNKLLLVVTDFLYYQEVIGKMTY